MTPLLPACPQVSTANLKAQGQTGRPGGTAEDRCESGCTWRGGLQQGAPAHEAETWSGRFSASAPAVSITAPVSAGTAEVPTHREGIKSPGCPWAVCNQMNRQIQSGLQILPSSEIRLLSNDCKNDAQLRRGSALNLNSCFNLSMPPVRSVPAEKETSTCCQHK